MEVFMKAILVLILLFLLLPFNSSARSDQDASKIAQALKERLKDALRFEDDEPWAHPQTKLRRFEDKNPMWLMLYVRPQQNKNFPRFHAKGFRVGLTDRPYYDVEDISKKYGFNMRHDSPWSIQYNGIGRMYFYRDIKFKNLWKITQSTDDHVKKVTFGSTNNALGCQRCSFHNPDCSDPKCGQREVIGSIKFDPGIAFYQKVDYRGRAELLTPLTYITERLRGNTAFCLPASAFVKKSKSFHFDPLVRKIKLFRGKNCRGPFSSYTWERQQGVVANISSHVRNRVESVEVTYKNAYDLVE
jgi:hypothetical protein